MITHEFLFFWKLVRSNREWSALVCWFVELQSFAVRDPHHAGSGATSLYYLLDDALQDASGYFLLQRLDLEGILQRTERRYGYDNVGAYFRHVQPQSLCVRNCEWSALVNPATPAHKAKTVVARGAAVLTTAYRSVSVQAPVSPICSRLGVNTVTNQSSEVMPATEVGELRLPSA